MRTKRTPLSEAEALGQLRTELSKEFESLAGQLPEEDNLGNILREDDKQLECCLLRFLRFNSYNVERTVTQVRKFVQWRSTTRAGCIESSVMRGPAGGISATFIPEKGKEETTLAFVSGRHFVKEAADREIHAQALIRWFDNILPLAPVYRRGARGGKHTLRKLHRRIDLVRSATRRERGAYLYATAVGCTTAARRS